jgi:NLI interacting factor-like phosphatase
VLIGGFGVVQDLYIYRYNVLTQRQCQSNKVSLRSAVLISGIRVLIRYADPVIDWLDSSRTLVSKRYFRDSCIPHRGSFLKDLSQVEKDLSQVVVYLI